MKPPTDDTTTDKIVWNSVVLTTKFKYMCIDINNFNLDTPLIRYDYFHTSIILIPDDIIQKYKLLLIVINGFIYLEIFKGMYVLSQAGTLPKNLNTEYMDPKVYFQCKHTPGLWRHKWLPILFPLVVDDFGVNDVGK